MHTTFLPSWQVCKQKGRIYKGEKEAAKRLEKGKGSATNSESLPNRPPTIWGYTKPNGDTPTPLNDQGTCEENQSYCLQSSQPLLLCPSSFSLSFQRSAWPPHRHAAISTPINFFYITFRRQLFLCARRSSPCILRQLSCYRGRHRITISACPSFSLFLCALAFAFIPVRLRVASRRLQQRRHGTSVHASASRFSLVSPCLFPPWLVKGDKTILEALTLAWDIHLLFPTTWVQTNSHPDIG